jgi:PKD repeat protein
MHMIAARLSASAKGGTLIGTFLAASLLLASLLLTGCPTETEPPKAEFSASPTSGPAPLTVTFADASSLGSGSITGYVWDFGDGTTSTDRNPSHTYEDYGAYTVTLTVTTSVGSDTRQRPSFVTAIELGGRLLSGDEAADWSAPSGGALAADAVTADEIIGQYAVGVEGEAGTEYRVIVGLETDGAAQARLAARAEDETFVAVYRFMGGICVLNRLVGPDGLTYLSLSMVNCPGTFTTPLGSFDIKSDGTGARFGVVTIGPVSEEFLQILEAHMPASISSVEDIPILVFEQGGVKATRQYAPNTKVLRLEKAWWDDAWDAGEDLVGDLADTGEMLYDGLTGLVTDIVDAVNLLSSLRKTVVVASDAVDHAFALRDNMAGAAAGLASFAVTYGGSPLSAASSAEDYLVAYESAMKGRAGGTGLGDLAGKVLAGLAALESGGSSSPLGGFATGIWGNGSDVANHLQAILDSLNIDAEAYFYIKSNLGGGLYIRKSTTALQLDVSAVESIIGALESGMSTIPGLSGSILSDAIDKLVPQVSATVGG